MLAAGGVPVNPAEGVKVMTPVAGFKTYVPPATLSVVTGLLFESISVTLPPEGIVAVTDCTATPTPAEVSGLCVGAAG